MSNNTDTVCKKSNAIFLMKCLISEVSTINDYTYSISLTENKELKDILYGIVKDEQEHYNLFLEVLRTLDSEFSPISQEIYKNINVIFKNSYNEYSGRKENKILLLTSIRCIIKRELETIILYDNFLNDAAMVDNQLLEITKKVNANKKGHVEKLTKLLVLLDETELES